MLSIGGSVDLSGDWSVGLLGGWSQHTSMFASFVRMYFRACARLIYTFYTCTYIHVHIYIVNERRTNPYVFSVVGGCGHLPAPPTYFLGLYIDAFTCCILYIHTHLRRACLCAHVVVLWARPIACVCSCTCVHACQ